MKTKGHSNIVSSCNYVSIRSLTSPRFTHQQNGDSKKNLPEKNFSRNQRNPAREVTL